MGQYHLASGLSRNALPIVAAPSSGGPELIQEATNGAYPHVPQLVSPRRGRPGSRRVRADPRPHRDRRDHRPHLPGRPRQPDPQQRRQLGLVTATPERMRPFGAPMGDRTAASFYGALPSMNHGRSRPWHSFEPCSTATGGTSRARVSPNTHSSLPSSSSSPSSPSSFLGAR